MTGQWWGCSTTTCNPLRIQVKLSATKFCWQSCEENMLTSSYTHNKYRLNHGRKHQSAIWSPKKQQNNTLISEIQENLLKCLNKVKDFINFKIWSNKFTNKTYDKIWWHTYGYPLTTKPHKTKILGNPNKFLRKLEA